MTATLVVTVGLSHAAVAAVRLEIEAPPTLASVVTRLESFATESWPTVQWLSSLTRDDSPITVRLADERSDLARETPEWIAGFALTGRDLVVLFPSRSPSFPDDSLEALLQHEVAHILIARAAARRALPRWFSEGLATAAEQPRSFLDRTRLTWAVVVEQGVRFDELSTRFGGGAGPAGRAYALSAAFVRDLFARHGSRSIAVLLGLVAVDLPFETAFLRATGRSLESEEQAFWARHGLVERWIPVLGSSFTLWSLVTLLALLAIWKRRRQRLALRRRWAEDEEPEADELWRNRDPW